jgi:DNA ligase-1
MKLKEQGSVDLVVESLIQGEGKYYGMLGAAVVKFKGRKVNVGSGWSDDERKLYWQDPTLLVRKVIEVHYHQITPDGSLRHPRFHTIRHDKSI